MSFVRARGEMGRLLLFLVLFFGSAYADKVLIITSAYNRSDFIEIQHKTFRAFLEDDYEFVVFNDAPKPEVRLKIEATCHSLGIRCINIPQHIHDQPYLKRWPGEGYHDPAVRNANVVMYALNTIGFSHEGIVAILDSDMFLIQPFSIRKYLEGYDLAGLSQFRGNYEYLWIGLAFLDMRSMPNKSTIDFNCGRIGTEGVDAGGQTYHYMQNNPSLKVRRFSAFGTSHLPMHVNELSSFNYNPFLVKWLDKIPRMMELHLDCNFLHYYAGSNWCNSAEDYLRNKDNILNRFMNDLIADFSGIREF